MRSRAISVIPLAALLVLVCWGTGASAEDAPAKTATVTGKVTFRGQPLPRGTVAFHPEKGKPIKAKLQEDGTYEAKKVPVGKVRLTVETESLKPAPRKPPAPGGKPPAPPAPAPAGKYIPIPVKYADPRTSGLTLDVKEGKQVHDIVLD